MPQLNPNVVRDWIALQHAEENSPEYERFLKVNDAVWDLTHEQPEAAWLPMTYATDDDWAGC